VLAILMSTLLLAAADPPPAAASPATPSPAPAARKVAERPTDEVCWMEKPTGSHITRQICATREQVEKALRDGQDAVSHNLHRGKPPMGPAV